MLFSVLVTGYIAAQHIWFAIALFLTLKSNVFPSRQTSSPPMPGSWPSLPNPPTV